VLGGLGQLRSGIEFLVLIQQLAYTGNERKDHSFSPWDYRVVGFKLQVAKIVGKSTQASMHLICFNSALVIHDRE
jgi:hypothetical protein